jgi:5'-3' exonuclease
MKVHLVDGTYELFRMFYGAPSARTDAGREVGASRALLRSLASLLAKEDVTHLGVAFDHVIESFRNELFDGYKTGEGIDEDLFGQFGLAEDVCRALGVVVWPMVEFEADDALAAMAARAAADERVSQVVIASPDKDLCQCVVGERVVLWDRRRDIVLDEARVIEKHGVPPASIPDLLALVGDTADGIPGIPRWGAKSAGAILSRYGHLDAIPADPSAWAIKVRGAPVLSENLEARREDAALYRVLATLRTDVPLEEDVDALEHRGVDVAALEALGEALGESDLLARIPSLRPA